jgi:hypothetical protein
MWCRVAFVRTDVSEERTASIIRVERIRGIRTTLAVTSNTANVVPSSLILFNPMMEAIRSSETSVLTRPTRRHIPEDDILHSHRRENLKFYLSSHFTYITKWWSQQERRSLCLSTIRGRLVGKGQATICVRFEFLAAVAMKNAVFCGVGPCGSC